MTSTGILLLYFDGYPQAPTVTDHFGAFKKYSDFGITPVNVHNKDSMDQIKARSWQAVIMHYTIFAMDIYYINDELSRWLMDDPSLKICFFQDEYFNCPKRFDFLNQYSIDAVYTLVEPRHFRDTYQKYTTVPFLKYTIPGYVSDGMLTMAERIRTEQLPKDMDITYRGRQIDYAWGAAGQEKHIIGEEFKKRTKGSGLIVDIETAEDKRIYGDDWYRFIARSKAVLGVEAGVSIFDVKDVVRLGVEELRKKNPNATNATLYTEVMEVWENNIFYRTISPRHFEAAALGACQILFEGIYSGIMDPWIHYIPLKKDFSNIDEVLTTFMDENKRQEITDNARRDMVDSNRYTYKAFIKSFDTDMKMLGLTL